MGGQKTGNRAACLEARKARRDVKVAKIEKIKFCILSTCWPLQASLAEVLENTLISLGPNAGYGLVMMMIMDMMGVARAGCPGWWWCVTRHLGHPCPGLGEWPGPHSWWQ